MLAVSVAKEGKSLAARVQRKQRWMCITNNRSNKGERTALQAPVNQQPCDSLPFFFVFPRGTNFRKGKIIREKEPFENNLMFVVVEIIWRLFVFCG